LIIAETRSGRSDINPCIAASRARAKLEPVLYRVTRESTDFLVPP
jgi:hypothetical protein